MVTLRNRAPIKYCPAKQNFEVEVAEKEENAEASKVSDYEQSREERIKENLRRMQKLGILDLSLKLKSLNKPTPKSTPSSIRRTLEQSTAIPPPGPRRRSSRLQNATPVNYSEVHLTKKDGLLEDDEHDLLREEGSKPEVYTEEHNKLLGSTEMSWTLFVDGYGRDGKRIYDPVNGKTCHQCRQKTLGHRTHCSKCNKVQGQFCGDCLYMRYGEHVLEANQNPNWICPVCRGICNCSLCRQAKGWPPTGSLYRKISSLGFKSVAHYIIQTRQKNSDLEATSDKKVPITVKRSLSFSNTDATLIDDESSEFKTAPQGLEYDLCEGQVTDNCIEVDKQQEEKLVDKKNEETFHVDCFAAPESSPYSEKKHSGNTNQISTDGIAGRLRRWHNKGNEHEEQMSRGQAKNETLDVEGKELSNVISPCTVEATVKQPKSTNPEVTPVSATDSIARRLRLRLGEDNQQEEERSTGMQQLNNASSPLEAEAAVNDACSAKPGVVTHSKSNKKRTHTSEQSPDSIAGRLRQRRVQGRVA